MHTIHEDGAEEDDGDDMLDNLAYGKTESGTEEMTGFTQFEHITADVQLKGNESYNSMPLSTSAQDEGEYAYPAFSVVSPA